MMVLLSLMITVALMSLVAGCGQKAPPVPWSTIVPKRIVDLEAKPREERLLLEWTFPKENTDKSVLADLTEFKILRSEGDLIGDQCRGCGEKSKVVYEAKLDKKGEDRGKKMALLFEDMEARKVYVYQVVTLNRRGYPSSPSNPVTVFWDYPPHTTAAVRAERGDKKVDIHWEPVLGATGYNIYRRGEGEEFSFQPLNRDVLRVTQYSDLSVENEKRYIYSVRAVKQVVKTDVEGKGSLSLPITPTDLIPPASPLGLVAIPIKNGMELNWKKNREPDLLGYYVYRRKMGETEFKRMTSAPLTKETYLDTDVQIGQDYEYAVTAVDNSVRKNESPLSEEVRVKYLY
ncbi:MAG: fibronectin type III domain-containing protein [Deltaproteobacteria bacterium]|nr:fibronectin type III domain-containing protein [Deltaproteobacteria bacterium]